MKILNKKYIRLFALLIVAGISMSFTRNDNVQTKTLTEQFMVNPDSHFMVRNDCGPIEFRSTTDVEARVEANIKVEGKTDEEIKKVLDRFTLDVNVSGSTISVKADDNVETWMQYNVLFYHKNEITFNDGSTADDITDTDISLVVYLPKVRELTINNKYDEVTFDAFDCDVNAQLMSSDFKGGNINGKLDLDMKYGTIAIGDILNGKVILFDSDVVMGDGQSLEIYSKYSDLKFGNIKDLMQHSFDDEIDFGSVEAVDIDAKYSEISFKDFERAKIQVFDSDIDAGGGKYLDLRSKYSDFDFKNIDEVEIHFFQDDFNMGDVKLLKVNNSKYSSFNVDKVTQEFEVRSSFQDEFEISTVGENISKVELESNYSNLNFPIPSSVAYQLTAKLRYCSHDFPELSDIQTKLEEGSTLELKCGVNNPTDDKVKVKINASNGEIDIK